MIKILALTLLIPISACSIGADKYMHATAGLITAATGKNIGFTNKQACAASLAIGVAKEIVDPIFSLPDVIATAVVCVPLLLTKENKYND